MRPAAARTALIEQNDPIGGWIEEATIVGHEPGAWSTVQKDDGLAVRRAALFVIKLVNSGHSHVPAVVWIDFGVKSSACFHIAGDYRVTGP